MGIDEIHDRINLVLNKDRYGYRSPEEIDLALDMAQMDSFNELRDVFGRDQRITDRIYPFVKESTLNITSGSEAVPTDFEKMVSLSYEASGDVSEVKMVRPDEFRKLSSSQLKTPDVNNVVGTIWNGNIELLPAISEEFRIVYLKTPAKPEYAYSQSGRQITFNQAGSTDLEWNDSAVNDIIQKAISILAQSIKDNRTMQYAEMKDQQGV